jgi:hypothetical protein
MNQRLSMLKRIEDVYGMMEEIHSVALRQAAALVQEAEVAIVEQCAQMREAGNDARQALLEGDRQQWLLAGAQRNLGGIRRQQLETMRLQRELVTDRAREEYGASRTKSEQMKSVVERCASEEQLIAGRKAQAATDDRFLSRLRWNELRFEGINLP